MGIFYDTLTYKILRGVSLPLGVTDKLSKIKLREKYCHAALSDVNHTVPGFYLKILFPIVNAPIFQS